MKILSCGAGMQSTALALMSCENKKEIKYKEVPIYDAVIFCDLGSEPIWVYKQVDFIKNACEDAEIPFYILDTHLHQDYLIILENVELYQFRFGQLMKMVKKVR